MTWISSWVFVSVSWVDCCQLLCTQILCLCFEIEIGNQLFLFSFILSFSLLNLSPYCLISPCFCLTLSTSSMNYLQNCVYRMSKFNLSQALLISSVKTNLIVYNSPFFPKKSHTLTIYMQPLNMVLIYYSHLIISLRSYVIMTCLLSQQF